MKNTQEIVRVVDDNNDQREALVFMLQTEGYEVQSYASAKAFLAGNMPSVPGVLILDLQMPEMNGLELQAELNRQGSTLPVIFLSAHGDLPQAVKAMKQGSCDFLEKPAEADLLLETVAKVLERDRIVRGAGITPRIAQLRLQRLSARELDVARLLAKGLLKRTAAERLGISEKTVDAHCRTIYLKLEINSSAELAALMCAATLKSPDKRTG